MLDMSELIHDPDFCVSFVIIKNRSSDTWQDGDPVLSEQQIQVEGVVTPTSSRDIQMLPEGDRRTGMMTFVSDLPLEVSNTITISDYCLFHGSRYKLVSIFDWSENGFFKALGSFVTDEEGCS